MECDTWMDVQMLPIQLRLQYPPENPRSGEDPLSGVARFGVSREWGEGEGEGGRERETEWGENGTIKEGT